MSTQQLIRCIPHELLPTFYLFLQTGETSTMKTPGPEKALPGLSVYAPFRGPTVPFSAAPGFTVAIARRFDTFPGGNHSLIMKTARGSELARHVLQRIQLSDDEWLSEFVKARLGLRLNSLLLYLINSAFQVEVPLQSDISRLLAGPDCPDETFIRQQEETVSSVLQHLIYDIRGTLSELETRGQMLYLIMEFLQLLHRNLSDQNIAVFTLMVRQLNPPMFLKRDKRARLALCMLHPDQEKVVRHLSPGLVRGPRLLRGWSARSQEGFRFEDWVEIMRLLPSRGDLDALYGRSKLRSFYQQFETMFWEGEITDLDGICHQRGVELAETEKQALLGPLRRPPGAKSDVLAMIFTVFQPNWRHLWRYQGFLAGFRVLQRVCFIRNAMQWTPAVKEFCWAVMRAGNGYT